MVSSRLGLPRRKFSARAVKRERKSQRARRLGRRRHALGGLADVEERLVLVTRRVLDRAADEADLGGEANRLRRHRGRVAEALFQIGGDGQIGRVDDPAELGQRLLAPHLAVTPPENAGGGAARGRERLEPEPGEDAGRAGVPRIGNHESACTLVQCAEPRGLVAL